MKKSRILAKVICIGFIAVMVILAIIDEIVRN